MRALKTWWCLMPEALIIPFVATPKPAGPEPYCTFCSRPKCAVPTLIVSGLGNAAAICGDCIKHAKTRLEEEHAEDTSV